MTAPDGRPAPRRARVARASLFVVLALALSVALVPGPARAQTPAPSPTAGPPLSVGVVVDVSASTREHYVRQNVKTLLRLLSDFVKEGDPRNEFFFVGAGTEPVLLAEWGGPESSVRAISKIRDLKPVGATALFDACYVSAEKVAAGRNPRKALVVFSDGLDTISLLPERDVLAQLRAKQVPVFAVTIGDPAAPDKHTARGRAALDRLAAQAGGAAFHPRKAQDFEAAFKDLAAKLRQP